MAGGAVGKDPSTVSKWCSTRRSRSGYGDRIAELLDVDIKELINK